MANVTDKTLNLSSNEASVEEKEIFVTGVIRNGELYLTTEPTPPPTSLLDRLKLYLDITGTDYDNMLLSIIADTKLEIENYCHIDYNDVLDHALLNMCVYRYNKLSAEGIESENYSGVGFHYMSDYPGFILRELKSQRKIRTLQ